MEISKQILTLLLILLVTACATTTKTGSTSDYYEDLSVLRPVYSLPESDDDPEVTLSTETQLSDNDTLDFNPQFDITQELDSLLDTIAVNNQRIRYVQGYTIQVYTGSSQDEANEAKAKVYQALPGSRPQVTYDLPNYKVKVGKYYYRLQAQKEFAIIRKEFPTAILAPQQFRID